MAKTPEGKIKERVKKALREAGCVYYMPIGSMYSENGAPDFMCWSPQGRSFLIETKAGKKTATVQQAEFMRKLSALGVVCIVVNGENIEDFEIKLVNDNIEMVLHSWMFCAPKGYADKMLPVYLSWMNVTPEEVEI